MKKKKNKESAKEHVFLASPFVAGLLAVGFALLTSILAFFIALISGFEASFETFFVFLTILMFIFFFHRRKVNNIRLSEYMYQAVFDQSNDILFSFDFPKGNIAFSEKYRTVFNSNTFAFNINKDRVLDHIPVYEEDLPKMQKFLSDLAVGIDPNYVEIRLRHTNGSYYWYSLQLATIIRNSRNAPLRGIGKLANIHDMKETTEILIQKAYSDPLTGLYNKIVTEQLINETLAQMPNTTHALFVLDADWFKEVNDIYGHKTGDEMLVQVAATLKRLFRNKDIKGRVGGDEFVILLSDLPQRDDLDIHKFIASKASQICKAFNQIVIEEDDTAMSCSVGVSIAPDHGASYETLFAKADAALYKAKELGRDTYCIYGEKLQRRKSDKERRDK